MAMAFRGIGKAMPFAPDASSGGDFMPVPPTPAPDPSGGFFGEGGTGRNIAGYIGDYLAQLGGGQPIFAPAMQRKQEMQQYENQRQQQVADWLAKEDYKRRNPEPSPIARDLAAYQGFTPEQKAQYGELQDLKAGPVTVSLPNGFVYSGNRSGLADALGGGVQSAQPQAPVPAPTMGANGNPQFLTPEQLAATEQSMGKAKTDAWRLRNRIPLAKTINGTTYYEIGGKIYDNPEGR